MSNLRASRRSEPSMLRYIRGLILQEDLEENSFLYLHNCRLDLQVSALRLSDYDDGDSEEFEDFELKFPIHLYRLQLRSMADYYSELSKTVKINNCNISVKFEEPTDVDDLFFLDLRLEPERVELTKEIIQKITIPQVLVDRSDYGLSAQLDVSIFLDISIDALLATAEHINFVPPKGRATRKGYLLPKPNSKAGPGTGSEIIVKSSMDDSIILDETELSNLFYSSLSGLAEVQKILLDMIEINIERNKKTTSEAGELYNKLQEKASKVRDLVNKLSKNIQVALFPSRKIKNHSPGYYMTRDTEFSAAATYWAVHRYYEIYSLNPYALGPNTTQFAPIHIIANTLVAINNPFFATANQLKSISRAQRVYDFFANLNCIFNVLHAPINGLVGDLSATNNRLGDISREHGPAVCLSGAVLAGVSLDDIQDILSRAILKHKWMQDKSDPVKLPNDKSNALFKFIRKIGMPIDISGTSVPSAERAISARLRDLGKHLSNKYNFDYNPDPGTSVLLAMRKSDDADEIMLEVTVALEDCFNLINKASE